VTEKVEERETITKKDYRKKEKRVEGKNKGKGDWAWDK